MKIILNRQSEQPVYLQIRDRISQLIDAGSLPSGSRLPSIRGMAAIAQVNKLTIVEAYGVLEADGLVMAKPGAGYFVSPPEQRMSALSSQRAIDCSSLRSQFAPVQAVIIPEHGVKTFTDVYTAGLQAHQQPGMVNFASGFPQASELDALARMARRAMKSLEPWFGNSFPAGDGELRSQIAQLLLHQGMNLSADNLIITNGSMDALSLVLQVYIQPGDWVVVESPTFHGFLSQLRQAKARVIGIPMTAEGMNLELLAQYLESHRPKLIYTISTLHNPTGITTSLAHRQKLFALADAYDCLILEDNAYEPLNFEPTPAPIQALDSSDRVMYVGTFSKSLMPGLRLGYLAATGDKPSLLVERKLLQDFHSSTLSQAIVKECLACGYYRHHLRHIRSVHQQKRDHMLRVLAQYMPPEVSWTVPAGGIFLWLQLPAHCDVQAICRASAAQKVLPGAGPAFFPDQKGYPALRLSFSQPLEEIERGIQVLAALLKAEI
jgi:DNA-binding transcriptional MocR family regulator